jgi:hypothetical protein
MLILGVYFIYIRDFPAAPPLKRWGILFIQRVKACFCFLEISSIKCAKL